MQQLTLGFTTPKPVMPKSAKSALREAANLAYFRAKREYFRLACREMGGLTPRTRDEVEHRVETYARECAKDVYLRAGYHPCLDPLGAGCDRLASPGYAVCPNCDA